MDFQHRNLSSVLDTVSTDQFWIKCLTLSNSSSIILLFIKSDGNVINEAQAFIDIMFRNSEYEVSYCVIYEDEDVGRYEKITEKISLEQSSIFHIYKEDIIDALPLSPCNSNLELEYYSKSCQEFCSKIRSPDNKIIDIYNSDIDIQNMPCVYVLESPSAPNILKIGYTNGFVFDRMKQIKSATGAFPDLECVAIYYNLNAQVLEKSLHKKFKHNRISKKREFFKETVDVITDYVEGVSDTRIFILDDSGNFYEKNCVSNQDEECIFSPAVSMVIFSEGVATFNDFKFRYLPGNLSEKYFILDEIQNKMTIEENFIDSIKRFSHSIIMTYCSATLNEQGEPIVHDHFQSMKKTMDGNDLDSFIDLSENISSIYDSAIDFGRGKFYGTSIDTPNIYRKKYSEDIIEMIDEYYILSDNVNHKTSLLYYSERQFRFFRDHMSL